MPMDSQISCSILSPRTLNLLRANLEISSDSIPPVSIALTPMGILDSHLRYVFRPLLESEIQGQLKTRKRSYSTATSNRAIGRESGQLLPRLRDTREKLDELLQSTSSCLVDLTTDYELPSTQLTIEPEVIKMIDELEKSGNISSIATLPIEKLYSMAGVGQESSSPLISRLMTRVGAWLQAMDTFQRAVHAKIMLLYSNAQQWDEFRRKIDPSPGVPGQGHATKAAEQQSTGSRAASSSQYLALPADPDQKSEIAYWSIVNSRRLDILRDSRSHAFQIIHRLLTECSLRELESSTRDELKQQSKDSDGKEAISTDSQNKSSLTKHTEAVQTVGAIHSRYLALQCQSYFTQLEPVFQSIQNMAAICSVFSTNPIPVRGSAEDLSRYLSQIFQSITTNLQGMKLPSLQSLPEKRGTSFLPVAVTYAPAFLAQQLIATVESELCAQIRMWDAWTSQEGQTPSPAALDDPGAQAQLLSETILNDFLRSVAAATTNCSISPTENQSYELANEPVFSTSVSNLSKLLDDVDIVCNAWGAHSEHFEVFLKQQYSLWDPTWHQRTSASPKSMIASNALQQARLVLSGKKSIHPAPILQSSLDEGSETSNLPMFPRRNSHISSLQMKISTLGWIKGFFLAKIHTISNLVTLSVIPSPLSTANSGQANSLLAICTNDGGTLTDYPTPLSVFSNFHSPMLQELRKLIKRWVTLSHGLKAFHAPVQFQTVASLFAWQKAIAAWREVISNEEPSLLQQDSSASTDKNNDISGPQKSPSSSANSFPFSDSVFFPSSEPTVFTFFATLSTFHRDIETIENNAVQVLNSELQRLQNTENWKSLLSHPPKYLPSLPKSANKVSNQDPFDPDGPDAAIFVESQGSKSTSSDNLLTTFSDSQEEFLQSVVLLLCAVENAFAFSLPPSSLIDIAHQIYTKASIALLKSAEILRKLDEYFVRSCSGKALSPDSAPHIREITPVECIKLLDQYKDNMESVDVFSLPFPLNKIVTKFMYRRFIEVLVSVVCLVSPFVALLPPNSNDIKGIPSSNVPQPDMDFRSEFQLLSCPIAPETYQCSAFQRVIPHILEALRNSDGKSEVEALCRDLQMTMSGIAMASSASARSKPSVSTMTSNASNQATFLQQSPLSLDDANFSQCGTSDEGPACPLVSVNFDTAYVLFPLRERLLSLLRNATRTFRVEHDARVSRISSSWIAAVETDWQSSLHTVPSTYAPADHTLLADTARNARADIEFLLRSVRKTINPISIAMHLFPLVQGMFIRTPYSLSMSVPIPPVAVTAASMRTVSVLRHVATISRSVEILRTTISKMNELRGVLSVLVQIPSYFIYKRLDEGTTPAIYPYTDMSLLHAFFSPIMERLLPLVKQGMGHELKMQRVDAEESSISRDKLLTWSSDEIAAFAQNFEGAVVRYQSIFNRIHGVSMNLVSVFQSLLLSPFNAESISLLQQKLMNVLNELSKPFEPSKLVQPDISPSASPLSSPSPSEGTQNTTLLCPKAFCMMEHLVNSSMVTIIQSRILSLLSSWKECPDSQVGSQCLRSGISGIRDAPIANSSAFKKGIGQSIANVLFSDTLCGILREKGELYSNAPFAPLPILTVTAEMKDFVVYPTRSLHMAPFSIQEAFFSIIEPILRLPLLLFQGSNSELSSYGFFEGDCNRKTYQGPICSFTCFHNTETSSTAQPESLRCWLWNAESSTESSTLLSTRLLVSTLPEAPTEPFWEMIAQTSCEYEFQVLIQQVLEEQRGIQSRLEKWQLYSNILSLLPAFAQLPLPQCTLHGSMSHPAIDFNSRSNITRAFSDADSDQYPRSATEDPIPMSSAPSLGTDTLPSWIDALLLAISVLQVIVNPLSHQGPMSSDQPRDPRMTWCQTIYHGQFFSLNLTELAISVLSSASDIVSQILHDNFIPKVLSPISEQLCQTIAVAVKAMQQPPAIQCIQSFLADLPAFLTNDKLDTLQKEFDTLVLDFSIFKRTFSQHTITYKRLEHLQAPPAAQDFVQYLCRPLSMQLLPPTCLHQLLDVEFIRLFIDVEPLFISEGQGIENSLGRTSGNNIGSEVGQDEDLPSSESKLGVLPGQTENDDSTKFGTIVTSRLEENEAKVASFLQELLTNQTSQQYEGVFQDEYNGPSSHSLFTLLTLIAHNVARKPNHTNISHRSVQQASNTEAFSNEVTTDWLSIWMYLNSGTRKTTSKSPPSTSADYLPVLTKRLLNQNTPLSRYQSSYLTTCRMLHCGIMIAKDGHRTLQQVRAVMDTLGKAPSVQKQEFQAYLMSPMKYSSRSNLPTLRVPDMSTTLSTFYTLLSIHHTRILALKKVLVHSSFPSLVSLFSEHIKGNLQANLSTIQLSLPVTPTLEAKDGEASLSLIPSSSVDASVAVCQSSRETLNGLLSHVVRIEKILLGIKTLVDVHGLVLPRLALSVEFENVQKLLSFTQNVQDCWRDFSTSIALYNTFLNSPITRKTTGVHIKEGIETMSQRKPLEIMHSLHREVQLLATKYDLPLYDWFQRHLHSWQAFSSLFQLLQLPILCTPSAQTEILGILCLDTKQFASISEARVLDLLRAAPVGAERKLKVVLQTLKAGEQVEEFFAELQNTWYTKAWEFSELPMPATHADTACGKADDTAVVEEGLDADAFTQIDEERRLLLQNGVQIMEKAEADLLSLSSFRHSQIAASYSQLIDTWQKCLKAAIEVTDIWLRVQRLFLHLHNLFTQSPSIKEALRAQADSFDGILLTLQEIVVTVKCCPLPILTHTFSPPAIPQPLPACSNFISSLSAAPGTLQTTLLSIHSSLEVIEKHLGEYLAQIRTEWPRFFHISDADLVSCLGIGLSQPTHPIIQRHLPVLFTGVHSLSTDSSQSREPIVVAIHSAEGESVALPTSEALGDASLEKDSPLSLGGLLQDVLVRGRAAVASATEELLWKFSVVVSAEGCYFSKLVIDDPNPPSNPHPSLLAICIYHLLLSSQPPPLQSILLALHALFTIEVESHVRSEECHRGLQILLLRYKQFVQTCAEYLSLPSLVPTSLRRATQPMEFTKFGIPKDSLLRRIMEELTKTGLSRISTLETLLNRKVEDVHSWEWLKEIKYRFEQPPTPEMMSTLSQHKSVYEDIYSSLNPSITLSAQFVQEHFLLEDLETGPDSSIAPSLFRLQQFHQYPISSASSVGYEKLPVLHLQAGFVQVPHSWEYTGTHESLVVTPLTARTFLSLLHTIDLGMGASPIGPAGTGKTETVRALAHLLGQHVAIVNCDDSFDLHATTSVLHGVAAEGSWLCFDEFNRLPVGVLSTMSTEILNIQDALRRYKGPKNLRETIDNDRASPKLPEKVWISGKLAPLRPSIGLFITMNPGYAGRAVLPDNLKALFRCVTLVTPDTKLIVETQLFLHGFSSSFSLASYVSQFFQLCAETLPSRLQYDWGLRSIKALLQTMGRYRRERSQTLASCDSIAEKEHQIFREAILQSISPRIDTSDLRRFHDIVNEVLPIAKVANPVADDSPSAILQDAIDIVVERLGYNNNTETATENNLAKNTWNEKIHQLSHVLSSRTGCILYGDTGTGKSSAMQTLRQAFEVLSYPLPYVYRASVKSFVPSTRFTLSNSTLSSPGIDGTDQEAPTLYKTQFLGAFDGMTGNSMQGWLLLVLREIQEHILERQIRAQEHSLDTIQSHDPRAQEQQFWIILDGDMSPHWTEALNSVLDESRVLTLPTGERISIPDGVKFIFETHSISALSPATITRMGIVTFPPNTLTPFDYFHQFVRALQALPDILASQELHISNKENETAKSILSTFQKQLLLKNVSWSQSHGEITKRIEARKGETSLSLASGILSQLANLLRASLLSHASPLLSLFSSLAPTEKWIAKSNGPESTAPLAGEPLVRKSDYLSELYHRNTIVHIPPANTCLSLLNLLWNTVVMSLPYLPSTRLPDFVANALCHCVLQSLLPPLTKEGRELLLPILSKVLRSISEHVEEAAVGSEGSPGVKRSRDHLALLSNKGTSSRYNAKSAEDSHALSLIDSQYCFKTNEWIPYSALSFTPRDALTPHAIMNTNLFIPTPETCRVSSLILQYVLSNTSFLLIGPSGSGKTMSVNTLFSPELAFATEGDQVSGKKSQIATPEHAIQWLQNLLPNFLDFQISWFSLSAATTPSSLFRQILQYSKYVRRGRQWFLVPARQVGNESQHYPSAKQSRLIFFLDEVDLTPLDSDRDSLVDGFIRQLLEHKGFWFPQEYLQSSDGNPTLPTAQIKQEYPLVGELTWVTLENILFVAACNPPSLSGRRPLSPRLLRHFSVIHVDYPEFRNLQHIYTTMYQALFATLPQLHRIIDPLVQATLFVFQQNQTLFTPHKNLEEADVDSLIKSKLHPSLLPTFGIPNPPPPQCIYSPRDITRWIRALYHSLSPFFAMYPAAVNTEREQDAIASLTVAMVVKLWWYEGEKLFADRLPEMDYVRWSQHVFSVAIETYFPELSSAIQIPKGAGNRDNRDRRSCLPFFSSQLSPHGLTEEISLETFERYISPTVQSWFEKEGRQHIPPYSPLVLPPSLLRHICTISHTLLVPGNHALLIGPPSTGKSIVAHISAAITGATTTLLRSTAAHASPGTGASGHHSSLPISFPNSPVPEEVLKVFLAAGIDAERHVLLLDAGESAGELRTSFVEALNALLSSGHIPGLFDAKTKEALSSHCIEKWSQYPQLRRNTLVSSNESELDELDVAIDGGLTDLIQFAPAETGVPSFNDDTMADALFALEAVDMTCTESIFEAFTKRVRAFLHVLVVASVEPTLSFLALDDDGDTQPAKRISSQHREKRHTSPLFVSAALFNRCQVTWFHEWNFAEQVQFLQETLETTTFSETTNPSLYQALDQNVDLAQFPMPRSQPTHSSSRFGSSSIACSCYSLRWPLDFDFSILSTSLSEYSKLLPTVTAFFQKNVPEFPLNLAGSGISAKIGALTRRVASYVMDVLMLPNTQNTLDFSSCSEPTFSYAHAVLTALLVIHYSSCSYLSLNSLAAFMTSFVTQYSEVREKFLQAQSRYEEGLEVLTNSAAVVQAREKEALVLSQEIQERQVHASEHMRQLIAEQQVLERQSAATEKAKTEAEKMRQLLAKQEGSIAAEIAQMEPILQQTLDSITSLPRNLLDEVRSLGSPPVPIRLCLEAVVFLLDASSGTPTLTHAVDASISWAEVRRLSKSSDFIPRILSLRPESIPTSVRDTIMARYIKAYPTEFTYERMQTASRACGPLFQWVMNQIEFSGILLKMEPLKAELAGVKVELQRKEAEIKEQEQILHDLVKKTKVLETAYNAANLGIAELQKEQDAIQKDISKMMEFLKLLEVESGKWKKNVQQREAVALDLVPTAIYRAAMSIHSAPLDIEKRSRICKLWQRLLNAILPPSPEHKISVGERYKARSEEDIRTLQSLLQIPQSATLRAQNLRILMSLRFFKTPYLIDTTSQTINMLRKWLVMSNSRTASPSVEQSGSGTKRGRSPITVSSSTHTGEPLFLSLRQKNYMSPLIAAIQFGRIVVLQDAEMLPQHAVLHPLLEVLGKTGLPGLTIHASSREHHPSQTMESTPSRRRLSGSFQDANHPYPRSPVHGNQVVHRETCDYLPPPSPSSVFIDGKTIALSPYFTLLLVASDPSPLPFSLTKRLFQMSYELTTPGLILSIENTMFQEIAPELYSSGLELSMEIQEKQKSLRQSEDSLLQLLTSSPTHALSTDVQARITESLPVLRSTIRTVAQLEEQEEKLHTELRRFLKFKDALAFISTHLGYFLGELLTSAEKSGFLPLSVSRESVDAALLNGVRSFRSTIRDTNDIELTVCRLQSMYCHVLVHFLSLVENVVPSNFHDGWQLFFLLVLTMGLLKLENKEGNKSDVDSDSDNAHISNHFQLLLNDLQCVYNSILLWPTDARVPRIPIEEWKTLSIFSIVHEYNNGSLPLPSPRELYKVPTTLSKQHYYLSDLAGHLIHAIISIHQDPVQLTALVQKVREIALAYVPVFSETSHEWDKLSINEERLLQPIVSSGTALTDMLSTKPDMAGDTILSMKSSSSNTTSTKLPQPILLLLEPGTSCSSIIDSSISAAGTEATVRFLSLGTTYARQTALRALTEGMRLGQCIVLENIDRDAAWVENLLHKLNSLQFSGLSSITERKTQSPYPFNSNTPSKTVRSPFLSPSAIRSRDSHHLFTPSSFYSSISTSRTGIHTALLSPAPRHVSPRSIGEKSAACSRTLHPSFRVFLACSSHCSAFRKENYTSNRFSNSFYKLLRKLLFESTRCPKHILFDLLNRDSASISKFATTIVPAEGPNFAKVQFLVYTLFALLLVRSVHLKPMTQHGREVVVPTSVDLDVCFLLLEKVAQVVCNESSDHKGSVWDGLYSLEFQMKRSSSKEKTFASKLATLTDCIRELVFMTFSASILDSTERRALSLAVQSIVSEATLARDEVPLHLGSLTSPEALDKTSQTISEDTFIDCHTPFVSPPNSLTTLKDLLQWVGELVFRKSPHTSSDRNEPEQLGSEYFGVSKEAFQEVAAIHSSNSLHLTQQFLSSYRNRAQ